MVGAALPEYILQLRLLHHPSQDGDQRLDRARPDQRRQKTKVLWQSIIVCNRSNEAT
eukprot:SAG31_NODE_1851_length_7077_cov_2.680854_3_plen_57_part_00